MKPFHETEIILELNPILAFAMHIICDPLCENTAKVIYFVIYCFLQQQTIILNMVKNIL